MEKSLDYCDIALVGIFYYINCVLSTRNDSEEAVSQTELLESTVAVTSAKRISELS